MGDVPRIRLRPMTDAEFEVWRAEEIAGYAEDLERNGRFVGELAKTRSEESFASLLPDGPRTEGHAIFVGEDVETGEPIGSVWLGPSEDPTQAYVWDVGVHEAHRGRGYGKALMLAFEDEARARGYTRIGLNVFGHNEVARRLYESLGYTEVARQMMKPLSGGGRGPEGAGT